jgi:ribonuclease-3
LDGKRKNALEEFIKKHGFDRLGPLNLEWIDQAFRHPSYVAEQGEGSTGNNQRLEFLGDSVIGLVTALYLYKNFPGKLEGDLTRMRSAVVCEAALVLAARKLELGRLLLLGKGERVSGGADRASNLADCLEALFGALFLSSGDLDRLGGFVTEILEDSLAGAVRGDFGDHKSLIQEWVQKEGLKQLSYRILGESGPDHDKTFCAGVFLDGQEIARDLGRTKQEAEQRAAGAALEVLRRDREIG